MTNDMTKGSPVKLILVFTLPLLIGNIFQQLYSMVDTIIVGKTISTQALAAVGSTGAISFLVMGFVMGVSNGFAVMVSQRFGANDKDGVRKSVATSFMLCILVTIVVTIAAIFTTKPLLRLMKTPSDIFGQAYDYIIVIYYGIVAAIFYNMVSSIVRALGDSRTPLIFLIVASLINIGLDFLFILVFKMGVAGAAWATVISQAIAGSCCLIYMLKHYPEVIPKKTDFKINLNFAWKHLRIGLPMAFQFSITAIGIMFIQSVLNSYGSDTIAGYTASSKIDQLATQVLVSFGSTMATFVGQNYGAGEYGRIRAGVKKCILMAVSFSIVGGALVILFSHPLTSLFINTDNPIIFERSRTYLFLNGIFYWVLAMLFIFRNALQGMGRGLVPLTAGIMELVMRFLASQLLAKAFGYVGVCMANPVAWIGATVILGIAYFVIMKKYTKNKTGNSLINGQTDIELNVNDGQNLMDNEENKKNIQERLEAVLQEAEKEAASAVDNIN